MKKKSIAAIIALILSLNTSVAFATANTRDASPVLSSYSIGLYAEGNSVMDIDFTIYGTDYMDKIGAYSLLIEEEILPDVWVLYEMLYFDFDDERYFSNDNFFHEGTYTFVGFEGNRYRATLTAYAELDGVSDTGEVTSPARLCVY